jgi:uncharacterized cupin superfamily protein
MIKTVLDVEPAEGRDADAATLHRRVFTRDEGNREYMGFIHMTSRPTAAGAIQPYRKSAEEVIYTLSGSMRLVMDDIGYTLTPGTVLAISRGQVISAAEVGPDGWQGLSGYCSQCPLYLSQYPRFPSGTQVPSDYPDRDLMPDGRVPEADYRRLVDVKSVVPVEGQSATASTRHRDVFSPSVGNRQFQSVMHLESRPSPASAADAPPFKKSGEEVIYTLSGSSVTIQNGETQHMTPGTALGIQRDDLMQSGGIAEGGTEKLSFYCMKCPLYLADHPRYANS